MSILICRICLEIVGRDEQTYLNANCMNEIDTNSSLGDLLEECVSEVNLQLTHSPLICKACLALLKTTILFKKVCNRTEEKLYNYMKFNDCLEKYSNIDLREVIILNNKLHDFKNISCNEEIIKKQLESREGAMDHAETVEQICRTCLIVSIGTNFISVDNMIDINETKISVKVLDEYVSSICLQSTNSLLICCECYEKLKNTYIFKQMCCATEEVLYNYMKLHDLHLDKSSNINLIDVLHLKNNSHLFEDDISGNINHNTQSSSLVNDCILDGSSISDHSISNTPRIQREASKIANNKILSLSKQDFESDSHTFSADQPKPDKKKMKSRKEKLNSKKSHISSKTNSIKLKTHSTKSDANKKKSLSKSRHFKCKKCQYKAYRLDLLIRHKLSCKNRSKNLEEIYNKICKYCSRKFSRNTHLKRHEFTHNLISNYICDKCGQGFAEKHQLTIHEAKHTEKEGRHKCNHCNKNFFRRCDLTAHIRRTVSKEKFMCKYCNKGFSEKRDRFSHISKYHTDEDLPFKCNTCPFSTVYSKRFKEHKIKCE